MQSLQVTKLQVSGRQSGNGAPVCGYATFSDGKEYRWNWHPLDHEYFFVGDRSVYGENQRFSFRSRKREAALLAAIN